VPAAEAARLFSAYADTPVLALAVSGGSDSLAMLHLAHEALGADKLHVLTVDHSLREGSRAEAEQVAVICAALGVPHHILSWDGQKPASGLQAAAREARYDLMAAWCKAHGVPLLLTAHTMEDQAETVAMRKLRTSSARSLAGIWPETEWKGVRVARPLLAERREGLRDYLRGRSIGWIEDPSNRDPRFERVRVRRSLAADEIEALARKARESRAETLDVEAAVQSFMSRSVSQDRFGLCRICLGPSSRRKPGPMTDAHPDGAAQGDGVGSPSREAIGPGFRRDDGLGGHDETVFTILSETLSRLIALAGSGERPEPAAVQRILREGRRATLGGAVIVFRQAEILVGREPGRIAGEAVVVPEAGHIVWDRRFLVTAPPGALIFAAGPQCPRPMKLIPAFIVAGLPAVKIGAEKPFLPHFHADPRVAVEICERFRL
jgi:tRNA(Ile)-lysidine synthase